MKYKEQALKKIEKIDHKVAALESAISRSENMSVITGAFRDMREAVASLRDTISIENDEMNYKRTSGKLVVDETGKGSGNKDTMLAQLADGEFVTKSKSVLGAGKLMGGKSKDEQRNLGAQFFYKQMAELEKFA